ncbi:MAG TPA: cytochrome c class I [Panacibacter sp.]|nr:cytochrome c class I [Panacibacter sp.]HNP46673.1 cytochrome c class I [Panacibacter sp.]
MKKYFISVALVAFMAACGGSDSTEKKDEAAAAPAKVDVTQTPEYKAGLALIAKNDCLTCHKTAEKLVGPAYLDVSNKYAGVDTAVAYLSHKVIAGGSGVWGSLAMTPHAAVSQADAEAMVKYILLLKDAQ